MNRMLLLKRAAYRVGALDAILGPRRRHALTVAMFHRVLPAESPSWHEADPTYTVSDELFGACIAFFAETYSVVAVDAVLDALSGGTPLPERPLLITFDDGWADNATCAAPILAAAGLPAVVFVVPDAVCDPGGRWWQEELTAASRSGRLTDELAARLWRLRGDDQPMPEPGKADFVLRLIDRLAVVDRTFRETALLPLARPGEERQMLTEAQVRGFARSRIAVGAPGATHVPLTLVADAPSELRRAQNDLARIMQTPCETGPTTMSFPHGRYSQATVQAARDAGYRAIFTSDPCLNLLSHGRPCSDVLGRISVEASAITDARGRFRPELLLLWLASRPIKTLVSEARTPRCARRTGAEDGAS